MLLAIPILIHWPHLTGWRSENPAFLFSGLARAHPAGYPGFIDGNAGTTLQTLGGLAARAWLHGEVPWWNPYGGVGLPLAAELQNAAFFLPFVLLLHAFDGVVILKIVMQIAAGLSALALLREIGISRAAALIGALCFELNGSFAWFGHGPILPIAFLPLLLFGIERARRDPWQGALFTGLALAWSLLAGFPETAYLDGLLALGWTLVRVRSRVSLVAVFGGGLVGLALAAPPLLAFLQSLPLCFLGPHRDFHSAMLAPANRAPLFFPYLYGPPMFGALRLTGSPSFDQYIHWFRTTAYLDLPLLALAAMAMRRGDGPRRLLAAWLAVALARALGLPGLTQAVNLIPLVRNTAVHLYILPSCQLAATILACLALDDWRRGALSRHRAACGGALVLAAALTSLPGAIPVLRLLRPIPGYAAYPLLSVAGAVLAILLLSALAGARPTSRRAMLLGGGLVTHAALLFFWPLLGGTPRPRTIDHTAIAFLARAPGLQRVTALGVLAPNYPAWFGIAAIEDNDLPVPQSWVDDVRATLLPDMDGVNNAVQNPDPPALAALRQRLPAIAAHGVSHLVLPAGLDPFAASIALRHTAAAPLPHQLADPWHGRLPATLIPAAPVLGATLQIGTYAGRAAGALHLTLCQAEHCATATAPLAGAVDNADLAFAFSAPFGLAAAQPVDYTIAYASTLDPNRANPPALWLWPTLNPAAGDPPRAPRLTLSLARPAGAPAIVYADDLVTVFQLPAPAPYVAASGCILSAVTRQSLMAQCAHGATLLRRELAYPGWRVRRNGITVPLGRAGIYQTVALPAGRSAITFRYAPPGILYAWLACAAGAMALTLLGWQAWRQRRS